MADGKAEVKIAKSPDEVWDLVGNFGGLADWMPGVDSCELDGDVRKLQTMGLEIHEQLMEHEPGEGAGQLNAGPGGHPRSHRS